jgi:hypothetical protein
MQFLLFASSEYVRHRSKLSRSRGFCEVGGISFIYFDFVLTHDRLLSTKMVQGEYIFVALDRVRRYVFDAM